MIKNSRDLDDLEKHHLNYAKMNRWMDVEHEKMVFKHIRQYFTENGFPEPKRGKQGQIVGYSKEENQAQTEQIRDFVKGELNKMVTFNREEAKRAGALNPGKQKVRVSDAEFKYSKTNKPMIQIKVTGIDGGFGNIFIVQSDWSDKNIVSLLSSADSVGAQIPEGYDFQLDAQLAGFIKQRVPFLYVSVKEDGEYTKVSTIRMPEEKPQASSGMDDPFAQVQNQPVEPSGQNPFARNDAQPPTGNNVPDNSFPPQGVNPNDLPFDMTGFGQ